MSDGISRLRIPTLDVSLIVFLVPIPLQIGNAFVGLKEIWPWFYDTSFYLAMSLLTTHLQIRIACAERELASFARILRPLGPCLVLYLGIPFYAAAAWADSCAMLSPFVEMLLTVSATSAALFFLWLFFRSWYVAIDEAGAESQLSTQSGHLKKRDARFRQRS